jgi:hypothetical protein
MLFRMVLSIFSFCDFAKPPGFNILIRIFCLVIVVFYNKDAARDRTCAARAVVRSIHRTYRTCGEKN